MVLNFLILTNVVDKECHNISCSQMLLKPKGIAFIIPKEVEEKEQLWGTGIYKFQAKFFSKSKLY